MLVMKFGGASVKDAESVRNAARIIQEYIPQSHVVIVVSAMDKTTNALERLADLATQGLEADTQQQLQRIERFHYDVVGQLFGAESRQVGAELEPYFAELARTVRGVLLLGEFPNRIYDRIMAYGELISSVILYHHLLKSGAPAAWVDARKVVATDASYKHAEVVWSLTETQVGEVMSPLLAAGKVVVTQGYIASTTDGRTTTLGREGSDYTASILGNALNAKRVIIWKDVVGVMCADPRLDPDYARKIDRMSYTEAVEMTFYGASIIHPKTIKPLENKQIPLQVKCFKDSNLSGTEISAIPADAPIAARIHKLNQALITLAPKDFSFMDEPHLRRVLDASVYTGVHINLIQTSAISLTLCVDYAAEASAEFASQLADDFTLSILKGLRLTTLLHQRQIPAAIDPDKILLQQQDAEHIHLVLAEVG